MKTRAHRNPAASRFPFLSAAALAVALACGGGDALAQATEPGYANRLAATRALMDVLSRDGGQPLASETLSRANGWLREAEKKAAAGDHAAARSLVDEAHDTVKATLVELKRSPGTAAREQVGGEANVTTTQRDHELAKRDIATTRALLDALRRDPATAGEAKTLAGEVDAAQALLDGGKAADALRKIEAAYGRAKGLLAANKKSDGRLSGSAALDAATIAPPSDRRAYENRLGATRALLDAVNRDAANPEIAAQVKQARGRLLDAERQATKKDFAAARRLVDLTHDQLKAVLIATRAQPGVGAPASIPAHAPADDAQLARDHALAQREIATTRALVDALRREAAAADRIDGINDEIAGAQALLDADQPHEALLRIDTTYGRAKALLGALKKSDGKLTGSASLDAERAAQAAVTDSPELRGRFARRDEAVRALQGALGRIADGQDRHRALLADSERALAEAKARATAGHYPDGIATLDRSYLLLKVGIGELRGGGEVKASKNFATFSDEYVYEESRNDDYAHLIDGMVARAAPRASWTTGAARAHQQRRDADTAAHAGEWKKALKLIDNSTREYKKILRDAGFPII